MKLIFERHNCVVRSRIIKFADQINNLMLMQYIRHFFAIGIEKTNIINRKKEINLSLFISEAYIWNLNLLCFGVTTRTSSTVSARHPSAESLLVHLLFIGGTLIRCSPFFWSSARPIFGI